MISCISISRQLFHYSIQSRAPDFARAPDFVVHSANCIKVSQCAISIAIFLWTDMGRVSEQNNLSVFPFVKSSTLPRMEGLF
jgi:hypothetical protein